MKAFIQKVTAIPWLMPAMLILLTLGLRCIYHVNQPFFEDEGIFLVDARNVWHLYENTFYMKPPLGAWFYTVAGFFSQPFLAIHVMTTISILITGTFLYKIMMTLTQSRWVTFFGCLSYLYCVSASVDGYGHSSLEHFQNMFLLAAFWWLFVREKPLLGAMNFLLSVFVLHNVVFAMPTLFPYCREAIRKWLFSGVIFVLMIAAVCLVFPNFFFNCFTFTSKFYPGPFSELVLKWKNAYIQTYLHSPIILMLFLLSLPGSFFLYKLNKRAAFFVWLVVGSVVGLKFMFQQHLVTLFPFMVILSSLTLSNWRRAFLPVTAIPLICVFLMGMLVYVNAKAVTFINDNGFFTRYTYNWFWKYRMLDPIRVNSVIAFLSTHKNQTNYIYPSYLAFLYPMTQAKTISAFASNDNLEVVWVHPVLQKLITKRIISERPENLIRTEKSFMDEYLEPFIRENYTCYGLAVRVCHLKPKK